jgi:hypothetical protein
MAGWDELDAIPTDIRKVTQMSEDLDILCTKVLNTEDGRKLMHWLRLTVLEQPVAVPGSDPSYAFYREGQCSIVRDLEARIKRALKPKEQNGHQQPTQQ